MITRAPAASSSSADSPVTIAIRRKPLFPASNFNMVRGSAMVKYVSSLESLHKPTGKEDTRADSQVATSQGVGKRKYKADQEEAQAERLHDLRNINH